MNTWWNELTPLSQTFSLFAIPATIILVIQTVLLLFGLGLGHDTDTDHEHDFSHEHDHGDDGLRLLTVRGMVAFFSIAGWCGIVFDNAGLSQPLTIILSIFCGLIALYLTAYILKKALQLQSSGNLKMESAIGKNAQVYVPIPESGKGMGKITLTVSDRFIEADAITKSDSALKTGEMVTVTDIYQENILIVERG